MENTIERSKLIKRIEKLEFCVLLLINQLRGVKEFPEGLLKEIEEILLTKEKTNG